MCPLELNSFNAISAHYPCEATRRTDIGALARKCLSPAVVETFTRAGFNPETLRIDTLEIGTCDGPSSFNFGKPQVGSIFISRPSAAPETVTDLRPALIGCSAGFSIGLTVSHEGDQVGPPQFEIDWRLPDQFNPQVHTAGLQNSSGVWELRFAREPREHIRKEIASVRPEVWAALLLAQREINRDLQNQRYESVPTRSLFDRLRVPNFGGLLGLRRR